jgi:hypothetical protein
MAIMQKATLKIKLAFGECKIFFNPPKRFTTTPTKKMLKMYLYFTFDIDIATKF